MQLIFDKLLLGYVHLLGTYFFSKAFSNQKEDITYYTNTIKILKILRWKNIINFDDSLMINSSQNSYLS